MMQGIEIAGFIIPIWFYVTVIYVLWVCLVLLVKRLSFRHIRRLAKKTATKLDDIFIRAIDLPVNLLAFASGGIYIKVVAPYLTDKVMTEYFLLGLKAITIVAAILFIERFFYGLITFYAEKVQIIRASRGVARGFIRTIVYSLGFLFLLDNFGVSITPILASLGIGSLAVALALQPTLENFFSGIQILVDHPVQIGQYIKLESGEEGFVHKISWRCTWIRMLPNNVIIVPNKALINSRILNYYYPEPELAVVINVGVHYKSDVDQVERVTVDVARQVMRELQAGVKNFEPFIRFHTLGPYSIDFSVILRASKFEDTYLIKHEFIKKLLKRYAKEGIVIPYPIQARNYEQEQAFTKSSVIPPVGPRISPAVRDD